MSRWGAALAFRAHCRHGASCKIPAARVLMLLRGTSVHRFLVEFIALTALMALVGCGEQKPAAPPAADAAKAQSEEQTTKVWRIGYLSVGPSGCCISLFLEGLLPLGYVEGQNVSIESRFANEKPDLLPGLAAELVRLRVAVIVAGDSAAIDPAKQATASIPIVMTLSGDPVGRGLIASLAHPGGNITGLTNVSPDLEGKRLQLLREVLPRLSRLAAIGPREPENVSDWRALTAATDALGLKLDWKSMLRMISSAHSRSRPRVRPMPCSCCLGR